MKHFPAGIAVTALFAAMLFFPKAVFKGASEGLLLWYQIIFPTLFPFLVITNLLLATGGLRIISRVFGRLSRFVFRVSSGGTFAVISGFLCGYPMGAKITADLLKDGRITPQEGKYLLSFCNNTSPIFIINFIVWKTFGKRSLLLPTLSILILVPILLSFIFRKFYLNGQKYFPEIPAGTVSAGKTFNFSVFDSCMMNSFEAIVKVGGYIILFSVLLTLLQEIPWQRSFISALAPTLEVTNGILLLKNTVSDINICYPAVTGLTAFGGFCSIAQTQCMLSGTDLRICPYIIEKLAAAAAASLLAVLYLYLSQLTG